MKLARRVRGSPRYRTFVAGVVCLILMLAGALTSLRAGSVKGRWYVDGLIGFHTTEDSERNNANIFGDPRPADFSSRESGVDDGSTFGLSAGYGLSESLTLQLGIGYFRGNAGPIDGYLEDTFPAQERFNPTLFTAVATRQTSIPTDVGVLTEIPVTLDAFYRFRTDRPLNPYIGGGVGVVYTRIEVDDQVAALQNRLDRLRIINIDDELGFNLTPEENKKYRGEGRVPFHLPIKVDVEDGLAFHLSAGLEYFFNDRLSLLADLRYQSMNSKLTYTFSGEDQLNLSIFSEKLFREDGSLKLFNDVRESPNPHIDNDPNLPLVACAPNTIGDFDRDGHKDDVCYRAIRQTGRLDPKGTFVVQGGEVDLSGYRISLGLRLYF